MANKVQFNLKNVHYALLTESVGTGGAITYSYGTVVSVPGAVSLSLEAQGERTPFHADGVPYFVAIGNNGYEGDLELAKVPDAMLKDIWGFSEGTTSKVLTEVNSTEPKAFALGFQIDGDSDSELYWLYDCVATRPAIASQTNTESKEPQTATCSISAIPRGDGKIFARTTDGTPTNTKTGWFSTVFVES